MPQVCDFLNAPIANSKEIGDATSCYILRLKFQKNFIGATAQRLGRPTVGIITIFSEGIARWANPRPGWPGLGRSAVDRPALRVPRGRRAGRQTGFRHSPAPGPRGRHRSGRPPNRPARASADRRASGPARDGGEPDRRIGSATAAIRRSRRDMRGSCPRFCAVAYPDLVPTSHNGAYVRSRWAVVDMLERRTLGLRTTASSIPYEPDARASEFPGQPSIHSLARSGSYAQRNREAL